MSKGNGRGKYALFALIAVVVGFVFYLKATDTGSLWQWGILLASPFLAVSFTVKAVKASIAGK